MINREDLLSGTRPEVGSRILVTEKESFQGYEVMDYKGMVWGISMRSKDVVQDIFMGFKNFVGGELTSYTELSDEARQKSLDRMLASARRIGANAVINFRFEITNSPYGNNAEVVAYGNAVVIRPIRNYVPTGGLGNILTEFVDAYIKGRELSENKSDENKPKRNIANSPKGVIIENNGFKFIACPHCQIKYKIDTDENGNNYIKGLQDIDPIEEGTQIYCLKCGKKFTI